MICFANRLEESKKKAEKTEREASGNAPAGQQDDDDSDSDSDDEEFSAAFEEALVAKYIGGMAS